MEAARATARPRTPWAWASAAAARARAPALARAAVGAPGRSGRRAGRSRRGRLDLLLLPAHECGMFHHVCRDGTARDRGWRELCNSGNAAGRADAGSAERDSSRNGAPATYLLIWWQPPTPLWANHACFCRDRQILLAPIKTLANPAPPPHQPSPRVTKTADASVVNQRPGRTRDDSAAETPETPGPKGRPRKAQRPPEPPRGCPNTTRSRHVLPPPRRRLGPVHTRFPDTAQHK